MRGRDPWTCTFLLERRSRRTAIPSSRSPTRESSSAISRPTLRRDLLREGFNGGALTPESSHARWMPRASEVDAAIVGESARWGDARRATPFKREVEWLAEQRWLRDTYWKANHPQALQRFKNVALYPVVVAPAFTQHGGRVERSFEFSITAPAGTVYFTLDGRDPRLPSGAVSPAALVADEGEPLAVEEAMTVKARALQGSTWSPLTEAYFFPDIPLRITEVMYHPAPPAEPGFPADDYEFIELQNIGDTTLELGGIRLAGAVEFDFSRG